MLNRYDALELLSESMQGSIRCCLRNILMTNIQIEEYTISNSIFCERLYLDLFCIHISVSILWESETEDLSNIHLKFFMEKNGRIWKIEWASSCCYEALRLKPIQEYIKNFWSNPLKPEKPN